MLINDLFSMKAYFTSAILCIYIVIVTSCQGVDTKKSLLENPYNESKEIAIIQSQRYWHKTQSRKITPSIDKDFLSENIQLSIATSARYARINTKSGSNDEDEYDSSEEIPIEEDVCENLVIYYDGGIEFTQETVLDTTSNPILAVYDYQLDLSHYVSRVEIADGICTSYNMEGELLYEGPTNVPDMQDLIYEMESYAEELVEEEDEGTRSASMKGLTKMRSILSKQYKDKPGIDYTITEINDGLEVSIKFGDNMVSRAVYDDNSLVTKQSDLFLNGQLMERQIFEYEDNVKLEARTGNIKARSNPSVVNSLRISNFADGDPCIIEDTRVYYENSLTYIPKKSRR